MSDGELWGGSIYSTRSNTYKLEVERPNTEGLKDGPIAGHISILASVYCQQAKDLLQLMLEGL